MLLSAHAQTAGWDSLDFGRRSGLKTDIESITAVYFVDTLHGLLQTNAAWYETTNGGGTWSAANGSQAHLPFRRAAGTFLYSAVDGFVSADNGATWNRPDITIDDPNIGGAYIINTAAFDADHIAHRLSTSFAYVEPGGATHNVSMERLALTSDGGKHWRLADSVTAINRKGEWKGSLRSASPFTTPPQPSGMTDVVYGWLRIEGMPDTSSMLVIAYANGLINDTTRIRYYLGRMNLQTFATEWSEAPMWKDIDPYEIDGILSEMQTPTRDVIFANDIQRRKIGTTKQLVRAGIWRSSDRGRTWSNYPYPSWLNIGEARFHSATYGVALNGVTNDGGMTWGHYVYPYMSWPTPINQVTNAFCSLDSLHQYAGVRVFNGVGASLFAQSSDAGATWKHSGNGASPTAIAADGGRVLIGRMYHGLMRSEDYGLTWKDVGADNGLPRNLNLVQSLGFVNPARNRDNVVGVAQFFGDDESLYIASIHSADGGKTWSQGAPVPMNPMATIKALTFAPLIDGSGDRTFLITPSASTSTDSLYTSDDNGATWTPRNAILSGTLTMGDADYGVLERFDSLTGAHQCSYTIDGGSTWTASTTTFGVGETMLYINAFSANDIRCMTLVGSGSSAVNRMYRSIDGGRTFNILFEKAATAPAGQAYWIDTARVVVKGSAIYRSTDGGRTFSSPTPIPIQGIAAIDDRYLYATSAVNKIGRLNLDDGFASVPTWSSTMDFNASIPTNPVSDHALLRYELTQTARIDISIIDVCGATVERFAGAIESAGVHEVVLPVGQLPSGHYIVAISSGGVIAHAPMIVIR